MTITEKDWAIVVLGARIFDAPLTASDRWRLAQEQSAWLNENRRPIIGFQRDDLFNSGRFASVTNAIGAISFGLVLDKKELPKRGVLVPKGSAKYKLENAEYLKADKEGHAYVVWKLASRKSSGDAVVYVSTVSSEFSLLSVWAQRKFETYISSFAVDRPGWYYLGEVLVTGYVIDSLRFERNPYGVPPSYGHAGYGTSSRYEYEKVSVGRVATIPVCDEDRFRSFIKTACMSGDFRSTKKRSEQECERYIHLCGSWQKVRVGP